MDATELLEKLNRCLNKFNAKHINSIHEHYDYFCPHNANATREEAQRAALLGRGSFGAAYRMKSVTDANEPVRAVKVLNKAHASEKLLRIQHLASELAVSNNVNHTNVIHRVGLYQTETEIFIPMELVEGRKPDLATRLFCIFAKYGPRSRIAEVPRLVAECALGDEDLLVAKELLRFGKGVQEDLQSGDLTKYIQCNGRVVPKKALIILKQVLEGLKCLHDNAIVHRDVKTCNVVIGEERKATPIVADEEYVDEGGNKATRKVVKGVRIEETLTVCVIDFGLVKYLLLGDSFPYSPSPRHFIDRSDLFLTAPAMTRNSASVATHESFVDLVLVTPCGSDAYSAPEVIRGALEALKKQSKWISDAQELRKFDVYGAGTLLYCMCNGGAPYDLTGYRDLPREYRLRELERLMAAGLTFHDRCPASIRPLISKLMCNDVKKRPSSTMALQDPHFQGLTNKYVREVMLDGTVNEVNAAPEEDEALTVPVTTADNEEGNPTLGVDDVMSVVRGREDGGDVEGDIDDVNGVVIVYSVETPPQPVTTTTTEEM